MEIETRVEKSVPLQFRRNDNRFLQDSSNICNPKPKPRIIIISGKVPMQYLR